MTGEIHYRRLTSLKEMRAAVELQQVFWGHDLESVVPAHMLFSLATYGGHVLAAFDGERMVGVLIGFLGASRADEAAANSLQVVSKRMVVLPEYRGQGIGNDLKLEQRKLAIEQQVGLVTWTFDPLMALNAHLNIRKLGGVSQAYLENYYGTEEGGGLTTLGFSDRLLVEWWVRHAHVCERLDATKVDHDLKYYLVHSGIVVGAGSMNAAGYLIPPEGQPEFDGSTVLLEIPTNYGEIVQIEPELAIAWRLHSRTMFQQLFDLKYMVTDFVHEAYEGRKRAFFVLSQSETRFDNDVLNPIPSV